MENKNALVVIGLGLILLMMMGALSVFNYHISKQVGDTGKVEKTPVSVGGDQQPDRFAPAPKTKTYKVEGFDYDPLAPVVVKNAPVVKKPPQEGSAKKVYDTTPYTELLIQ